MATGERCNICDGSSAGPRDILVELRHSWVSAPKACLPGYVCVVAREHVTEPFELTAGPAWWNECMAVARALKAELKSPKLNYEIHGNTVPHLHMHLYPRFAGDPFTGRPIDGRSVAFSRSPEDLTRIRRAILTGGER